MPNVICGRVGSATVKRRLSTMAGVMLVTPWPYNDQPAGLVLPDFGLPADEGARLRDRIWALLLSGRDDPDYFAVVEGGEWAALTREQLVEVFQHARQARVRQQAQWSGHEIRTNLDLAFDDLNAAGIVARQDFTCCGTCGSQWYAHL